MKLILTADVDNLGAPGDTVEVKDGYGRNYLLPRGLAIVATRGAEKQVDGIRRAQEARAVRGLDHAKEIKAAIEGLESVSLTVKTAGDTGKLFGSVTAADIVSAVHDQSGVEIDRKQLQLDEPIKDLGSHQVMTKLHADVEFPLSIEVVPG